MNKNECQKLYNKIADAFQKQSGGDYNDTLYYQWLGALEEMNEADYDGDWEYAHKNLSKCWKYAEHCLKIDKLQQEMPNQVYG